MWTIRNYIDATRILLQDTVAPYRYEDNDFKLALDFAFDDAKRLRPDMFVRMDPGPFMSAGVTTPVPVPDGYKSAWVFFMAGWIQLRDQEDTNDNRAGVFMNKYTAQLMSTAS